MDRLSEQNKKTMERAMKTSPEALKMSESFKREFGYEINDAKNFPVVDGGFNFWKAKEKLMKEANGGKMRENEALSSWINLTRAGINNIANNAYQVTETSFEQWVTVTQSKKKEELYAPIQGITFPGEVAAGGKYPEAAMDGLNTKLENKKFGEIFGFELELGEDDQTSQVYQQSRLLGEYMKVLWEVLCQGKLASITAGCTYSNLKVPASETKPSTESTWPWSTALKGGGRSRPDTFVVLSQPNLQAAFTALAGQKNLLSLYMGVHPDTLLTTPYYRFDSAVLQNSTYYPSNVIATNAGTTTGGPLGINPLVGTFKTVLSTYMFNNSGAINPAGHMWYLMDSKKPWFVLQIREATSVIAEAPNAGQSFERDVVRFKARQRGNADVIDSRFCFQGNDGSV